VITTTSPSTDGFVGELITTALAARGVTGLVTTTGVRDAATITSTRFPVWSRAVSAQGTVKATAGAVNVPISIAGTIVMPGDAVIADDDGVVVVPRLEVAQVAEQGRRREEREERARAAFAAGELSLDRNGLRSELDRLGVRYVSADPVTGLAADPQGS
jgi:4-hydroxy-4-methyl-2-oxoglutarate aldolase